MRKPWPRSSGDRAADLVAAGFGLDMLSEAEQNQLFELLRRVRDAKGDFVDGTDGRFG